ncbi:MAG: hypothetical protein IPK04_03515 [Bdellovibrionales bacterium]|nr:hypothetical protein [Bdellovibrionales bacterium]
MKKGKQRRSKHTKNIGLLMMNFTGLLVRSVKEMNVLGLFVPDEGLVRVAKGTRSWPQVVALLARSAFIFFTIILWD